MQTHACTCVCCSKYTTVRTGNFSQNFPSSLGQVVLSRSRPIVKSPPSRLVLWRPKQDWECRPLPQQLYIQITMALNDKKIQWFRYMKDWYSDRYSRLESENFWVSATYSTCILFSDFSPIFLRDSNVVEDFISVKLNLETWNYKIGIVKEPKL